MDICAPWSEEPVALNTFGLDVVYAADFVSSYSPSLLYRFGSRTLSQLVSSLATTSASHAYVSGVGTRNIERRREMVDVR